MRVLDLFSGIGGFSLGLERAGFTTAAFCEIDPFCRRVLAKHWPGVPIYDDVRELDAARLRADGIGRIDVVTGGYPCQPFSHAGKRAGTDDARHLWPAMRRVVGEVRPAWIVAENVAGHITLGLDQVLADLEADGYAGRAVAVPACAKDAPHIRQRVWIIGRRIPGDGDGDGESDLPIHAEMERLPGDMADTDAPRLSERPGIAGMDGAAPSRHQGQVTAFRGRWNPEPRVGRVAHGIPRRMDRLKALGNAVVPQVVEEIGRAIMQATTVTVAGVPDGN